MNVAIAEAAAPSTEANDVSIGRAGASIDGGSASNGPGLASVEQKEQAIEASLQSIAPTLQSIEEKDPSIEPTCFFCGPNRTFGVETFSFHEENSHSIETN